MLKQLSIILHIPDRIRIPDKFQTEYVFQTDNDVIMGLALLSYIVLRRQ
jgi:hypothetical protein